MSFGVFLLILLIAVIIYLIWATGILEKIEAKITEFPSMTLAYIPVTGPYKEAYKKTAKVEQIIKEKTNVDLSKQPCFGIYYDNPQTVEPSKCRSIVGKLLPDGFKLETIEGISYAKIEKKEKSIQVEYPLRSIFGIFAGIYRCYPVLQRTHQLKCQGENVSAAIEIYGWKGNKILFATVVGEAPGVLSEFPKEKAE
ncbi:GyrI-like domain-containing protein [Histomonas meleagridis]|uniref:GyrI-like domain-containing protein n=1 Tax=Histomonas meleagridis TaxID=135588 RepID=UPI0035594FDB|nr:GyrI-like domain-containing protein [Histomonas meleagridis]KAH0800452.1 GyrI-like domain-containing protein [Histomonas meleagridis]